LDVAQAADAVGAEEAARPFLAPDQAGGKDGAVFQGLVRPNLDVRPDHGFPADRALVPDDAADLDEGVLSDQGLGADDAFMDGGLAADAHPAPKDAVGDVGGLAD